MKDLTDILDGLNKSIDDYHTLKLSLVSEQSEILRSLSVNLAYLEEHRIEAYEKWQSIYFQSTGKTNAAKEREADMKVPERYQIKRIMTGAKIVFDAVRSTIGVHKQLN